MSPAPTRPDRRLAWGWVAHLRAGGTTPWADWSERGERAAETGRFLPGAQQLELLRRVNLATRTPVAERLATRVLEASAPGRGRPDLELTGADSGSRFGPRPVDPTALPDDELLRVAAGLIAEDLVAAGLPARLPPPLTRPWRRSYRIVGDPVLADPLRAGLVARGRPPGGGHPRILVMGGPTDRMLADAFQARALDVGGPPWHDWMAVLVERDHLAPRVDLAQVARVWERRTSVDRVTLVLDPRAVPRLVGLRRRLSVPPPLAAEAVDLARRVAGVLGLLVPPDRRTALLRETLAPRLADTSGSTWGVPADLRPWLTERAGRMHEQLRRAGYAVAGGDLDGVLPAYPDDAVDHVADDRVLGLAIDLLLMGPAPRAGAGEGDG